MARDFQRQLENEANLAELNRMTDLQTKEAVATTRCRRPSSPALRQLQLLRLPTDAAPLAGSGYPYGAPESAPAVEGEPRPGDDTYSHAHGTDSAAGDGNRNKPVAQ